MTTKQEHFLACLAEEAGEVVQAVGKILRFGLDDKHPKTGDVPNRELLAREIDDLIGVARLLRMEGLVRVQNENHQINKMGKVIHWYENYKGHADCHEGGCCGKHT